MRRKQVGGWKEEEGVGGFLLRLVIESFEDFLKFKTLTSYHTISKGPLTDFYGIVH